MHSKTWNFGSWATDVVDIWSPASSQSLIYLCFVSKFSILITTILPPRESGPPIPKSGLAGISETESGPGIPFCLDLTGGTEVMPRPPPNWPKKQNCRCRLFFSWHRHFTGNNTNHMTPMVILFLFDLIILHFNIPLSLQVSHRHWQIKCVINISSIKKKYLNLVHARMLRHYQTVPQSRIMRWNWNRGLGLWNSLDLPHSIGFIHWKPRAVHLLQRRPRRTWQQRRLPPPKCLLKWKIKPRTWRQGRVPARVPLKLTLSLPAWKFSQMGLKANIPSTCTLWSRSWV